MDYVYLGACESPASLASRTAAVLVDELDTCGFQCPPNYVERGLTRLTCTVLQLMDRNRSDPGLGSQMLLTPSGHHDEARIQCNFGRYPEDEAIESRRLQQIRACKNCPL